MPDRLLDIKSHRRMPVWQIVEEFRQELRGRERNCLEIVCGYCDNRTIVEKKKWLEPRDDGSKLTKPCTYCFRTGWLPTARAVAAHNNWEVNLS